MATKAVACVQLGEKLGSFSEAPRKEARALRYDNLASVLVNLDEHVDLSAKRKRDRNAGVSSTELAELRANLAFVKAENERLAERVTSELERLADLVAELQARARQPWWRRIFHASGREPGRGGRPKALARLKALSLDAANQERRPT